MVYIGWAICWFLFETRIVSTHGTFAVGSFPHGERWEIFLTNPNNLVAETINIEKNVLDLRRLV